MGTERIIAVGGGKGGTGKSVIAANCAIAMAELGASVTLVDADLGMANQHTMFGIDHVSASLHDFLSRKVEQLGDLCVATTVPGLSLIPGSSAHPGDANIKYAQMERLLREIRKLENRVVVINVGAGVHHHTVDLFDVADLRLVVVLNQLVSFQNAYGFLKASVLRTIRRAATSQDQRMLFVAAQDGSATERLGSLIARISHVDPGYGQAIAGCLAGFQTHLVGNMLTSAADSDALHAFARMVSDFLGITPTVLGWVRSSNIVLRSVVSRRPFMISDRQDDNARELTRIARSLLAVDVAPLREKRAPFLETVIAELAAESPAAETADLDRALERFKRRHPRFKVDLGARIITVRGLVEARVLELSRFGALIRTACGLEIGGNILLQVDTERRTITTRAIVRNQRPDGKHFGVEFEQQDCIPMAEEPP